MRIHREGLGTILLVSFIFIVLSLIGLYIHLILGVISIVFAIILIGFVLWFFRNPIRRINPKSTDIIAPVDGKVVVIKEVFEKEFLQTQCIQVSIFMSPLNVHVCRYPVSGKVIYNQYHPGKYLVAWHEKSSELNERTTVVVEANNHQQILFRQIAGKVARRIVNYAQVNATADAGKEYGFIKFGSRVDVFLPIGTNIKIKVGDVITRGGEQVIAELIS